LEVDTLTEVRDTNAEKPLVAKSSGDNAIKEANTGKEDLAKGQKDNFDRLKAGGTSGITREFGKPVLVDMDGGSLEAKSTEYRPMRANTEAQTTINLDELKRGARSGITSEFGKPLFYDSTHGVQEVAYRGSGSGEVAIAGGDTSGDHGGDSGGDRHVFDPKRNHPGIPDDTAIRVADAVKQYEEEGHGKVYNDHLWTARHGTQANVMQYLYYEEGNSATGAIANIPPLRSGHEADLYDDICKYARSHDISDPNQKISPDMLMKWSLQACQEPDGNVSIQDALLTVHNVMRGLARPDVGDTKRLAADDPVRKIMEDATAGSIKHGVKGLPQIMREKYHLTAVDAETGTDLFDRNNPYSVFKPMTDHSNSNAGSNYHFWVGAFASSAIDAESAAAMVYSEGVIIKKNNAVAQDEMPWGYAGVRAYQLMDK
jgi:hypothetical protein